jgi:hypothetical protein
MEVDEEVLFEAESVDPLPLPEVEKDAAEPEEETLLLADEEDEETLG